MQTKQGKTKLAYFGIASLLPAMLLIAVPYWGVFWIFVTLFYMTVFVFCVDEIGNKIIPPLAPTAASPHARALLFILGLTHFAVLFHTAYILGFGAIGFGAKLLLFWVAGLYLGQVSNSVAHELIHDRSKFARALGTWIYITLAFGHHTSAHPLIHHRYVATDLDPNSARLGESIYRFLPRAWRGSFMAGFKAEQSRLIQTNRPFWAHPYVTYIGGSLGIAVGLLWTWGIGAFMAWVALACYAQLQLLLSDYVQHYGLRRHQIGEKPEHMSEAHSWDAPHPFSAFHMFNAPRHSDHHMHPNRSYPELTLNDGITGPRLPYSLPVMASLALAPRLWRRVMDKRVRQWTDNRP
ncbi:MAG: alkane 1-monooxygenase [Halocynthiibacter sp.]